MLLESLFPIQCTVCLSNAVLVIHSAILTIHCSRQLTYTSPTGHQQSADCLPTLLTKTVGCLSVICRPTYCRPLVGRKSADSWSTVDCLSAVCRPTVCRQLDDSRRGVLFFTITTNYLRTQEKIF